MLLLVVAMLILSTALHQILTETDPDAPPPRWMAAVDTTTPLRAYLLGAALMLIGAKFWAFTLPAVGATEDEALGMPLSVATFLTFVLLSVITHVAVLAMALLTRGSEQLLGTAVDYSAHTTASWSSSSASSSAPGSCSDRFPASASGSPTAR